MNDIYSDDFLSQIHKKMSQPEKLVLKHLESEIAYDAHSIAIDTGVKVTDVVLIRKYFARKGITQLVHLRGDGGDSPFLAGKGYVLTDLGLALKHYIWP